MCCVECVLCVSVCCVYVGGWVGVGVYTYVCVCGLGMGELMSCKYIHVCVCESVCVGVQV